MPYNSNPKVQLIDSDGDALDDGDGKLNANATVVGNAAENAAVAGNPVLVGGRFDSSARTLGNGDVGAIALDAAGAAHIWNRVLDVYGGGAESGALRVTLANDSTGVVRLVRLGFSAIASGENNTVGTSAEVLTSSTPCKHVDIMATIANTGIIYVGGSGVTTSTGIALYPGDVYSVDIDNLNDIYVLATVDGENVQYTYYT